MEGVMKKQKKSKGVLRNLPEPRPSKTVEPPPAKKPVLGLDRELPVLKPKS
jgi:hypothetical protein